MIINSKIVKVIFLLLLSGKLFAEESGLPQFDTSKFSQQIFWLIVIFSLLFLFIKYVSVPKIKTIKNFRKNKLSIKLKKIELAKRKIASFEKEMIELRRVIAEKEISLKQDLMKKISALSVRKQKSFELYAQEKKDMFNQNQKNAEEKNIKEKQDIINTITGLILDKIKV